MERKKQDLAPQKKELVPQKNGLESEAQEQAENFLKMISKIKLHGSANSVPDHLVRESTSRQRLIETHILCTARSRSAFTRGTVSYATTVSLGYQPTVPVDMSQENRSVTIADLCKSIGKPMFGRYFFCRTVVWPYKQNAVQTVVEDVIGTQAVLLSLYNYVADEEFDPYALPRGTPLVISNPWFKVTGNGGLGLRCDNPSEVNVLQSAGNMWKPLDLTFNTLFGEQVPAFCPDWKERGQCLLRQGLNFCAIRAFTSALHSPFSALDASILSNRAAAFLNTGLPVFALSDAEMALKINPFDITAIWRKCIALSRTKKHKEAIAFLKKIIPTVPDGLVKELKELLAKTEAVWETGRLGQHALEVAKKSPPGAYLNYVEYKGPIRVAAIEGKGRGIVATRNIPFGQLIIASRAFEIATHSTKSDDFILDCNVYSKVYKTPSYNRLVTLIAQRLMTLPDLRKEFYQLSAGKELGHIEPKKGDMGLLVDMQRIDGICKINAFGTNARDPSGNDYSGIWILPSFINHTCVDNNVMWYVYGDFIFVVAVAQIKKGEEILMPYFNAIAEGSFEKCQETLSKYEFTCSCRLCKMGKDGPKNFII